MWKMIKSHFHGTEWKGMWKGIRKGKRRLNDKPFISMSLDKFYDAPIISKILSKTKHYKQTLGISYL